MVVRSCLNYFHYPIWKLLEIKVKGRHGRAGRGGFGADEAEDRFAADVKMRNLIAKAEARLIFRLTAPLTATQFLQHPLADEFGLGKTFGFGELANGFRITRFEVQSN